MASTPPASPPGAQQRPLSAMLRSNPNRSSSRMSMSSRHGGSRASDEDGKTAVKVAIRVRPPLKPEDPGFDLIPQRFRGSAVQVTSPTGIAVESAQGKKLFVFDRVFGEDVDQEGVWEYLNESVNSFVQGYNVSILAYGQSGAGKSYTMGTSGPGEQGDLRQMGVIPRAAAALFEKLTGTAQNRISGSGLRAPSRYSAQGLGALQNFSKGMDKNWQLKATYVEIYQEQLRDLLLPETVPPHERSQVTIREDPKGRIILTGLHQATINSIDDLLNALNFGSAIRQTDATAINARSSRSHAVFSLNLVQKRTKSSPANEKRRSVPIEAMSGSESWVTVDSKLHFVDLAGSERLKNTGAQGERAKEGISINAGLASLGKVISQLSSRSAGSHVSYRDSKLTRLLQDSLGGNAITYMVACVNPAEFHLSETLNTVQYAQRARAIQIKPQIQQVHDDSDKQAVIERLRAEVSFLRDQIRLSERTERRNNAPQERAERQHEREVELQNQLLDTQENYNALSQRHAKLISEITKARDTDAEETPMLKDAIGESALERLKRSNSFAEGVEQLVLEYEKTIQTLEASLSQTRSSLSNSESTLLEKETKIAYMETVQQQLQARIQKAMDRESDSENYMRELEARIDGITSGEEKSSTLIQELRKELARTKESEASAEEYISTLEERLAEAEQDHEMMQREIDRLEHVVERQRSIGKLDNLLYELDHIRQNDTKAPPAVNGHSHKAGESSHLSRNSATSNGQLNGRATPTEAFDSQGEVIPEIKSETAGSPEVTTPPDSGEASEKATPKELAPEESHEPPQSPAQSKFVADKLETVTQELFDLRMEHDATVNEFDELQRKYQMALNTLAELQDAVDEARATSGGLRSPTSSRPTSFLAHAGMSGLPKEDGQPSSSRTLSSELSLAGESTITETLEESSTTEEAVDVDAAQSTPETSEPTAVESASARAESLLAYEMSQLKKLNHEKEERMAELHESYVRLQEKHQDTLDYVEELKAEVHKANMARPASPTQVIRRKSSQTVVTTDRATRSIASLRNMALESFEEEPDIIANFELNLNAIMTELHMRSERVQALETEISSVRKEMESKMAIITGLTRERSSLKGTSPMDISVVATLRDQLLESENQMRSLQETHANREQELQEEIDRLKASLQQQTPATPPTTSKEFETTTEEAAGEDPEASPHQKQISALQKEVGEWKSKHLASMETTKASEQQLQKTISELEHSLQQAERNYSEQIAVLRDQSESSEASAKAIEAAQSSHDEVVSSLRKEIEEHKATAASSSARLAELEVSHANILKQVEEDSKNRELTERELRTHRDLVANLEGQIEEHKSKLALHQQGLSSLQESHSKEMEQLNEHLLKTQAESNEKLTKAIEEHKIATSALEEELAKSRTEHKTSTDALQAQLSVAQAELLDLVKKASAALNKDTDSSNVHLHIEELVTERKSLLEKHDKAVEDLATARADLDTAQGQVKSLESAVGELKMINEETLKELERISEKEKKSSRLVEELEEQLSNNYDQHQAANNRLSALQTERQAQLGEAIAARQEMEKELDEARGKISALEAQLASVKRNSHRESLDPRDIERSGSANSNLRKSSSHNSLPSPPPAIPLPPLPGSPPPSQAVPSPPTSRHQSKDIAQAQLVEDQEARIRTIEKHLFAEKQLTATLEEALTDLEASSTKVKSEMESWKKKCRDLEEEVTVMRKERQAARHSLQAVEEERNARMRVEAERAHLEARMAALNSKTKKKKSALNCF